MKTITKSTILLTIALLIPAYTYNNELIENNKTAYDMAAYAAYQYLDYTHEKGATANMCSIRGQGLCRILGSLTEKSRLFSHPNREDLKELSRAALTTFRDFDYNGRTSDRVAFVQNLIHILQATLPLLEGNDLTECRSLIQRLSNTIS